MEAVSNKGHYILIYGGYAGVILPFDLQQNSGVLFPVSFFKYVGNI